MKRFWLALALIGAMIYHHPALAEVSDKAATMSQHWYVAVPLTIALYFAGRFRWWLGAFLGILPTFLLIGAIEMALDPHVGRGLWREQGWLYFMSLWSSDMLMLAAMTLGIYQGWRRQTRPVASPRQDEAS